MLEFTTMLLSGGDVNLSQVTDPIVNLINTFAGPVIGLVTALGVIYCILLGVKLAKAEEPQDREKAKGALKNAIIGFVLIFVLIVALTRFVPVMVGWTNANGTNVNITTTGNANGNNNNNNSNNNGSN